MFIWLFLKTYFALYLWIALLIKFITSKLQLHNFTSQERVMKPHLWRHLHAPFIKVYPQYKFLTGITWENDLIPWFAHAQISQILRIGAQIQTPDTNTHMLIKTYIKKYQTWKTKNLLEDKYVKLLYTGTRLGTKINVKDKNKEKTPSLDN